MELSHLRQHLHQTLTLTPLSITSLICMHMAGVCHPGGGWALPACKQTCSWRRTLSTGGSMIWLLQCGCLPGTESISWAILTVSASFLHASFVKRPFKGWFCHTD